MKNDMLGENLRYLRRKHNMSQEEFAERLGYSSKNISKWETGISHPKFDVAMKIADMFGLNDINELFFQKIDFIDSELDQDYLYSQSVNHNITIDSIKMYYLLLKHQDEFQYDYSTEFDIEFIMDSLSILKSIDFITSYNIKNSNNHVFINHEFSDRVLQNKDKSFRNILKSMSMEKFDFSDEKEYQQYIKSLNMPLQILLVLDFIDTNMNITFTLNDLYCDDMFDKFSENKYINRDFKTIIRTSLTKLCSYGIIIRQSRGIYKKKHHRVTDIEVIDYEKYDNILRLNLNSQYELSEYNYYFNDLSELGYSEKQIISNIKIYLNDLINRSLLESYVIYIKNIEIYKVVDDNQIKHDSHIDSDLRLEIQT